MHEALARFGFSFYTVWRSGTAHGFFTFRKTQTFVREDRCSKDYDASLEYTKNRIHDTQDPRPVLGMMGSAADLPQTVFQLLLYRYLNPGLVYGPRRTLIGYP